MNSILRVACVVVWLAVCGCAVTDTPAVDERDVTSVAVSDDPTGDSPAVNASAVGVPVVLPAAMPAKARPIAAPTEAAGPDDDERAADESRRASRQPLTQRQRRLFILGIGAQEDN